MKKKLVNCDQLKAKLKIAEAEYEEALVEYQEELKEARMFDLPSPTYRYVEYCEENIASLYRQLERLKNDEQT